jgi:Na+-transporting NADH:ubiquinone oxidoreductase subunit F
MLFFGGRKPEDLYYFDHLKSLEKKLPDFQYIPVLSRVDDDDNWSGEKGRVTDLISKHVPPQAPADAYICGAPPVVESCIDLLTEKGIPPEHIFFDKFA